ncbi:serine O-acetyltransferase [Rhizobium sp. BE258]|uniref:serine O-acetyltransferase n=1 Tax=Rhizobium sp. BE258 TaxID=2817722 RepID=UPI00285617D8|nr:serine O-acetyltransferase [Rhizobium sp. BE258]MDR7145207.1 serine O-acetyltransferase [Rhizobium sp. BE258]
MASKKIGLLELISEDFKTQREGLLSQGFWALFVYRLSHPRMKCRIPVVRQLWGLANLLMLKFIEVTCGISLPEAATVGRRLQIEHFGSIIIHGAAVIGDDCLIRHCVTLGNKSSDRPMEAPRLGNNVNIGAGAKIIGNVLIGDFASIGANAVVTKDVPARSIAVGVPAKIIR